MRILSTVLLLSAALSPLTAQRQIQADSHPIVHSPGTGGQNAAARLAAGPTNDRLGDGWRAPDFITPIHTQADDLEGGAYGIWAAGRDYKASFHGGATYVPFLGGSYHYGRKRIVSSQVAHMARPQRDNVTHAARLQRVLELLGDEVLDELVDEPVAFAQLPALMSEVYRGRASGRTPTVAYD